MSTITEYTLTQFKDETEGYLDSLGFDERSITIIYNDLLNNDDADDIEIVMSSVLKDYKQLTTDEVIDHYDVKNLPDVVDEFSKSDGDYVVACEEAVRQYLLEQEVYAGDFEDYEVTTFVFLKH